MGLGHFPGVPWCLWIGGGAGGYGVAEVAMGVGFGGVWGGVQGQSF